MADLLQYFVTGFGNLFREEAEKGKPSLMRLLFVVLTVGVLVVWVSTSLQMGQMQDLPNSVAAIIASLAGGKAVQRFAEKKK